MSNEVIGSVKFSLGASLKPWNDPTQYCLRATADLIADLDDLDDFDTTEVAGRIDMTIIRFAEAFNDEMDLRDVFHEAEMDDVYEAMFDEKGRVQEHLNVDLSPGEVVYVKAVQLEPKYESTRLLVQAIETTIASLTSMGLIVALEETLDRGNAEWKQLGFDPVGKSCFVYRDDYGMNPRRKAY